MACLRKSSVPDHPPARLVGWEGGASAVDATFFSFTFCKSKAEIEEAARASGAGGLAISAVAAGGGGGGGATGGGGGATGGGARLVDGGAGNRVRVADPGISPRRAGGAKGDG